MDKQLSIIIPSFRDERIAQTIASVRLFDDAANVRLVIVDGGSGEGLLETIRPLLQAGDVLVSEPDKGIFDALNKGLERCTTPYLGWLGSDDLYTDAIKSSEVVRALADHDLFVTSLYMVDGPRVVRKTHSRPSALGLARWGLHNPHYATFGRTGLLASERFETTEISADIDYFLRIFARHPRVAWSPKVGLLQAVGGFSNSGWRKSVEVNRNVFQSYRKRSNALTAALSVGVKVGYKVAGAIMYRLRPNNWHEQFPSVARLTQQPAKA